MPETWTEICRFDELSASSRKLVKIDGIEIALFNVDGLIYAIKNRCPHRGGPLIRGFIDPTGGIKCPMHGWRFDLRDGSSERPAKATVYPVKIEDGMVHLCLP